MQPSSTLYSGIYKEGNLVKFCSKECKQLWFSSPDQESIYYVASLLDESCQPYQASIPLMTVIVRKETGVEQIFLSIRKVSEGLKESDIPFIIWHVRELEHQHFAHFYIAEDCLLLEAVWSKQYCTSETEVVSNIIATKRLELQSQFQVHFNQAVGRCGFDDFEAFLAHIKKSKQISLQTGK